MKLFTIFTASALLATTLASEAPTCQQPLKVGGKKCFTVKKKGFKKTSCSGKDANDLQLTNEGKFCDGPYKNSNCLVQKGKKFEMASSGLAVLFKYDEKSNSLKAYAPSYVKNKFMQIDKKVKKVKKLHKKNHKKYGVFCSNEPVTTPAPTVPSHYFKCYHRKNMSYTQEGRVLYPKIENPYKKSNFSGFLIHEKAKWWSVKLHRFGWYANLGWSRPDSELFTGKHLALGVDIKGSITFYQTKKYDYQYNGYMYKYLNVGQTKYSYRKSAYKISDGDLIKMELRLASCVWQRNGTSMMYHYWESGDERNLYPAFDMYYSEENFTVTVGEAE